MELLGKGTYIDDQSPRTNRRMNVSFTLIGSSFPFGVIFILVT